MVDKVDDNSNEVLRGASQVNELLNKYELITSNSGITQGISFDGVYVTYTTLTDVFEYRIGADVQGIVTITYAASNKKDITSIVRT